MSHPCRRAAAGGARLHLCAQARRRPRFTFGTGKFGDLAGFTSAIVLAMIALLIGYEAVSRLLHPVPIQLRPRRSRLRCSGSAVNVASAWLLSGGDHHHATAITAIASTTTTRAASHCSGRGAPTLEVFEDGVPPRFRLAPIPAPCRRLRPHRSKRSGPTAAVSVSRSADRGGYLESRRRNPRAARVHGDVAADRRGGDARR